jgi:hypothetical protein
MIGSNAWLHGEFEPARNVSDIWMPNGTLPSMAASRIRDLQRATDTSFCQCGHHRSMQGAPVLPDGHAVRRRCGRRRVTALPAISTIPRRADFHIEAIAGKTALRLGSGGTNALGRVDSNYRSGVGMRPSVHSSMRSMNALPRDDEVAMEANGRTSEPSNGRLQSKLSQGRSDLPRLHDRRFRVQESRLQVANLLKIARFRIPSHPIIG